MKLAPQWPVAQYLNGRSEIANGKPTQGLKRLINVAPKLTAPSLKLETWRLVARTLFDNGCQKRLLEPFDG